MRVTLAHDGADLCGAGPLFLAAPLGGRGRSSPPTRIGITKDADRPLRFFERGNPFVSGPRRLQYPPSFPAACSRPLCGRLTTVAPLVHLRPSEATALPVERGETQCSPAFSAAAALAFARRQAPADARDDHAAGREEAAEACQAINEYGPAEMVETVEDGLGDWLVWVKDKDGDLWMCNANADGASSPTS